MSEQPQTSTTLSDYNPFTRLLWYAAGVDRDVLAGCPFTDRVKWQGIGGIVLATALLAFVSGSYAFYVVFGPKDATAIVDQPTSWPAVLIALGCGLTWSLVVFNLDRFIVSSTGHGDGTEKITLEEFVSALPRLLMATIIGFCLSAPLEIRILKTEIDTALAGKQKEQLLAWNKQTSERFEHEKVDLTAKLEVQQKRLDTRAAGYEMQRQEVAKQRKALEEEAEGNTASGKAGRGPAYQVKDDNLKEMLAQLERTKTEGAEQDKKIKAEMLVLQSQLDEQRAKIKREEADNEHRAEKMDGLMMRIHISHEIGGAVPWLIAALLLSIEICPIFFKMMLTTGAYEYLVDNRKFLLLARQGIRLSATDVNGNKQLLITPTYHQVESENHRQDLQHDVQRRLSEQVMREHEMATAEAIALNPQDYLEQGDEP